MGCGAILGVTLKPIEVSHFAAVVEVELIVTLAHTVQLPHTLSHPPQRTLLDFCSEEKSWRSVYEDSGQTIQTEQCFCYITSPCG